MSEQKGSTATKTPTGADAATPSAKKKNVVTTTLRLPADTHAQMSAMVTTPRDLNDVGQSTNEWILEAIEDRIEKEIKNGWGNDLIQMVQEMQKTWAKD